jgi:hypothetical protein
LRRAVAQSTCSIARSEVAHKESSNRANTALYQRFGFEMAAWRNQIRNDPDTRQFFATTVPSEPFPGTPAFTGRLPQRGYSALGRGLQAVENRAAVMACATL